MVHDEDSPPFVINAPESNLWTPRGGLLVDVEQPKLGLQIPHLGRRSYDGETGYKLIPAVFCANRGSIEAYIWRGANFPWKFAALESCHICQANIDDAAAYITSQAKPVCAKCLVIVSEEYQWDPDSDKVNKVSPTELPSLPGFSEDELAWLLQRSLKRKLPTLHEPPMRFSDETRMTLMSILDEGGIPTLEPR
ncbi:MAG: hypothetical protein ACE5PO_00275 [Candidatus Bathyarchaeia archaeon]